jgi:hypothetical protein
MDIIQDVIEYDSLEVTEWYVDGEGDVTGYCLDNVKLLRDVICYDINYDNYSFDDDEDVEEERPLERKFLESGTVFKYAYLIPSLEWLVLMEDCGQNGELQYTLKLKTVTISFSF